MARLMAFDFGTKRLGIAVTDPLQIIATALTTIHPKDIVTFLNDYLKTETIDAFVVGEPKQMDSSPSESARHVDAFINLLKKQFPLIPIERMDERFTSKMASQTIAQSGLKKSQREKKELIDTVSAVIILQSYMEKRSFGF
ncbi:Holliday junction resolvase RuvX [Solitalea sp. MAHUQ-68]|uniref:Putative pre-16S rRNA nuclease n=1 Tax=Solitalea agri TaxID=2953739 RepID=A0A9X2JBY0_9SPHI|nr:Holliday junction resolvase RuvX [Solitalea agri]MCO4292957.1 Holliday junction resolvase RuvX [Solitalea agri]